MIKLMVRCIILAGSGSTTAASATELPAQILVCRTVADAVERAECYDQAVDALAPPAVSPEVAVATPPKPQSSPTPSIAPTLAVAAEPESTSIETSTPARATVDPKQPEPVQSSVAKTPADPKDEVVELKQQVADLEQQVAVLVQETAEPGSEPLAPEDLFGKEETESRHSIRKLFGLPNLDQIEATLAEVKRTPYDKLVMVLDNGQIWMQTDSNRLRVRPGDGVLIKAARFGSFLLEKQTGSRSIRVKRVD